MKKYKHFIFDFDGVISDSFDLAVEKFNHIREASFNSLPKVVSKQDMSIVYAGLLKTALNPWIGQDGTKSFFDQHSKLMRENAHLIKPFDGIISVLNALGEKNVSIVTSSYSHAVMDILKKDANFNDKLLHTIAGRELKQSKTLKIHNILNQLNLPAQDAIYIGDLESDILYCKKVPIDIVCVGYGYHPISYLQNKGANFLVDSVKDLGVLLTNLKQ